MYKGKALDEMKKVFAEVPYGIDHTLKVLENAEFIMNGEGVSEAERELIALTVILHDIGAIEAQRKHGSMDGRYQEMEGPAIAKEILDRIGYDAAGTQRICYIISYHHTPSKIDGLDFQIQWEADLVESLPYMEVSNDKEALKKYIDENYKTGSGRNMAYQRFKIE